MVGEFVNETSIEPGLAGAKEPPGQREAIMNKKLRTLQTIDESGAVLIVRLESAEVAEKVAEAAIEGGFRALEITLSIPGAVEVIRRLAAKHGPSGVAVGAGTVLDEHSAYECIRAGAEFLVSPQLNPAMIRTANRYQVPTISGAFTPTEFVESAEAGADILKLFPTEAGGVAYAKAVLAPLAHLPIMPAGGVTLENVGEWFAAGVAGVGVGSYVTKAWQPDGDFTRVTEAARAFLAAVAEARG
ncbi:2-dehydro-3-deoxyphosphogluconate aldolase/4-hydroxy-2-oxoglutarate aldolase [Arthrobacter sp. Rue61a]|jgi:2-dehydro-3-deoxyphosphogluconate aldolase/(4S)-4-hydroxy-2-oxoglutarate aldolase|nr:2-dehydro-3-deoxyphosphogluconate aldolase/4-hydroxy-2-oxoglutarate aldolase [Arthrobacter sp. Rue61a]KIA72992.1 2-dehydro-3-deoxyphosphogluconate aldolase [Arthrobacter sp. MWB30]